MADGQSREEEKAELLARIYGGERLYDKGDEQAKKIDKLSEVVDTLVEDHLRRMAKTYFGAVSQIQPKRVRVEGFKPSAVEQLAQAVLDGRVSVEAEQKTAYDTVYRLVVRRG